MKFLDWLLGDKKPKAPDSRTVDNTEKSSSFGLPPVAPIPVKLTDKTGDDYIHSCFHFQFQQYKEARDWSQIPEAVAIPRTANSGQTNEALRLAEQFVKNYRDFDFGYYWLGNLYLQLGLYGPASKAVTEGLQLSKSKYSLCRTMGMIHLKVGELPDAVKWWIRSLVIRISSNELNDVEILIYLSYVAEGLELNSECLSLRKCADEINTSQIRLASEATNKLFGLARTCGSPSIKRAIALFVKEYIIPRTEKKLQGFDALAPNGVYCAICKTRIPLKDCISPRVVHEGGARGIIFDCPKCRTTRVYRSDTDTGF
jgi:hypothetical protein